jgi:hypothetical protein
MDKDYNGSLCIHELMEWNDTKYWWILFINLIM